MLTTAPPRNLQCWYCIRQVPCMSCSPPPPPYLDLIQVVLGILSKISTSHLLTVHHHPRQHLNGTAFFIITAPGKCAERLLEQSPSKNTGLMALFNFVSKVFLFVILTCFFILFYYVFTSQMSCLWKMTTFVRQMSPIIHSFISSFIQPVTWQASLPCRDR